MNNFADLRDVKLKDIRPVFSQRRYERSTTKALSWYAFDLLLYLSSVSGILLIHAWWIQSILSIVAGTAIASMFVWAHDAAHGSLFKSRLTSEILGTLFMLPSLNMYRLWAFGHNRVHHGFTSLSIMDDIWRPWTRAEYERSGIFQKILYRMERSPYFCALHYLLRVWWPNMIMFSRRDNGKSFAYSKLAVALFFIAFISLSYYASGAYGMIAAVILPFIVFNYYISLFIFLHHTHPDIPFFDNKNEWSQGIGQVYCSTITRCSRFSEYITHNILIHTPHHSDTRIPFYHLKEAYADMLAQYSEYIHEMRFSIRNVMRIFAECKLYDYTTHTWSGFEQG